MKKGVGYVILFLLVALSFTSCKRHWRCSCTFTGIMDTTIVREYWDYNKADAEQLCKAEEEYRTERQAISCEVH
jgi:hypothetical protein